MKRALLGIACALVLAAGALAGQRVERVDAAAIAKIRDEGLRRSQVMDTLFWLTDRYGPRVTGSPEYDEAADWAMARLRSWGVVNLHKERFKTGRGWSLVRFNASMVEPRVMPMIGFPKAGSAATPGKLTADVVRIVASSPADLAKYRGTLRGKIVLTQPEREVRMLEAGDGMVLRYTDQSNRWLKEALTPGPLTARRGSPPTRSRGPVSAVPAATLLQFFRDEGVAALFDRGLTSDLSDGGSGLTWLQQRTDGGNVLLQDFVTALPEIPQVTLAVEHYNRMVRLLDHSVPVKVELDLATKFTEETEPRSFNIVGEIPGTDKADEIVLIGAHFDSFQGATGATDNASGSAAMMEVLRILKVAGLAPRRTIRIGLWAAEEMSLLGSQMYVAEHLGTPAAPKPELGKLAAYFNLDNGTGKIRGVWMQGNTAVRPIFEAWSLPLKDLGVEILSPRGNITTDHASFDAVGVPAFQFVQERYEYNSRTHHTNMDFYDRIQPDDMTQMATVAAVFAWHAATRDDMLPRKADASR
jgi:carboxypeptidase Q